MSILNFPEWFQQCNSHMFLSGNDGNWELTPPNQLDWIYIITLLENNKWQVHGIKQEYNEEINMIFEYKDKWIEIK